jgi:hypothetical protein
MSPIPLGRYRHYKGNEYEVIGFAKHSETLEVMVIYKALSGERGVWVSLLSLWENAIETEGKTVKQFEFIGDSWQADCREDLLHHIDKLQTTVMGIERIRKNLSLEVSDVVAWCREQTAIAHRIERSGKNWYVHTGDIVLTINAHSYTIITAHKMARKVLEHSLQRAAFEPL